MVLPISTLNNLKISILIILLYPLQINAVTEDQFSVYGLSAFDQQQETMLKSWLKQGVDAARATLGVYPTPLAIHIYPKKSNQPVPWAYTRRDEKGSIHFYVDTRFGLTKLVNDWTIYHELAHMALPYLGRDYRWFSEGFASFMQYQIMHQVGVLKGSLDENYQKKIAPHLRWFNSELTAAAIATRLMDNKQFPAAYWGSAYFFIKVDAQLRALHKVSLIELISHYQDCCRAKDNSIEDVMNSLDDMLDGSLFTDLLKQYNHAPAKTLYPESF